MANQLLPLPDRGQQRWSGAGVPGPPLPARGVRGSGHHHCGARPPTPGSRLAEAVTSALGSVRRSCGRIGGCQRARGSGAGGALRIFRARQRDRQGRQRRHAGAAVPLPRAARALRWQGRGDSPTPGAAGSSACSPTWNGPASPPSRDLRSFGTTSEPSCGRPTSPAEPALVYDTRDNEYNTHKGLLLEAGAQLGSRDRRLHPALQRASVATSLCGRAPLSPRGSIASGMGGTPTLNARLLRASVGEPDPGPGRAVFPP